LWSVVLHTAVRSVACTPAAAPTNLVLAGTNEGSAYLINLDGLDRPETSYLAFPENHQSAINCVAFSPDGALCATGGEDRSILIWKVLSDKEGKGKLRLERLHRLTAAHKAPVTGLQFVAPDPSDNEPLRLISVGGDKTLVVWDLKDENKAPTRRMELDQRGGHVEVLGSDGQRVLFDQEKELRLRSLKERTLVEGRLRNPPGAGNFTTMALFSPDGKTILTNSASESRLQLWRTPPPYGRGSELRQFMWNTGPVTCGAFAPDGSFVVTGTQDQQVLVWKMPSQAEAEQRLTAHIKSIEKSTESSSRQVVRISAELDDRPDWVVPGGPATIVISPDVLFGNPGQ
jgi:WD40 repeat protein